MSLLSQKKNPNASNRFIKLQVKVISILPGCGVTVLIPVTTGSGHSITNSTTIDDTTRIIASERASNMVLAESGSHQSIRSVCPSQGRTVTVYTGTVGG